MGLGLTVKLVVASVAAANETLPACDAFKVQVPALSKVTVAPETELFGTVHTEGVRLVTTTGVTA